MTIENIRDARAALQISISSKNLTGFNNALEWFAGNEESEIPASALTLAIKSKNPEMINTLTELALTPSQDGFKVSVEKNDFHEAVRTKDPAIIATIGNLCIKRGIPLEPSTLLTAAGISSETKNPDVINTVISLLSKTQTKIPEDILKDCITEHRFVGNNPALVKDIMNLEGGNPATWSKTHTRIEKLQGGFSAFVNPETKDLLQRPVTKYKTEALSPALSSLLCSDAGQFVSSFLTLKDAAMAKMADMPSFQKRIQEERAAAQSTGQTQVK